MGAEKTRPRSKRASAYTSISSFAMILDARVPYSLYSDKSLPYLTLASGAAGLEESAKAGRL